MPRHAARRPPFRLDESLLSGLSPFVRLDRRQIREVLDQAVSRRHPVGAAIFDEGAAAERFFLLLDGHVRVVRITETGEQVIALHIPPGELLGIAPAIGRETYPATAIAATEALTLGWPARLWPGFVRDYPGFADATYQTVGRRIGEMSTRIVELATQQVEQRIANAILRLINQSGRKTDDGIEIAFPITRQDLSELTGTTLHTVSRLLSGWERQGLVKSARRRIVVCDAHALMLLSGVPEQR